MQLDQVSFQVIEAFKNMLKIFGEYSLAKLFKMY